VPATFFLVGELLEDPDWAAEAKDLLSYPLFDVQSHTYTHIPVIPLDLSTPDIAYQNHVADEIKKTNAIIEKVFGTEVIGFRTPGGYENGLGTAAWLIHALWRSGIRYSSSQLTGPGCTNPSPLAKPYWNETDILHPILELPACDWHDNALKGFNRVPIQWPPLLPWGYPTREPTTPQEEFEVYKQGIDYVFSGTEYLYYSPIMHPWSVYRFNHNADTIGLILSYVKELGMECRKFSDIFDDIDSERIVI